MHLYIDGAWFEALRQRHFLLEVLEVAELKRDLPIAAHTTRHVRKRQLFRMTVLRALDLNGYGARHARLLAHRLHQHHAKAVVKIGTPRYDLEALQLEATDTILGR